MFCSSVKPQKLLQEQHGTNIPGTPKHQADVFTSPALHRQLLQCHRDVPRALTTLQRFTLGFREEADVQLSLTPRFRTQRTQRAFRHPCLCLQSHCQREVHDRGALPRSSPAVLLNSDSWVCISHPSLWQWSASPRPS